MIYTWAADITPLLEEECYRHYYLEAPIERRKKADRLKRIQNKAQSIGVWTVYERMKAFYQLDGSEAYNFSHSGNYVLCSVYSGHGESAAEVRVGCDVEKVQDCRLKMAEHFFCESEYQCIAEKEGVEQKTAFYRYWVLKESFLKATQKGMALGLDTFEIRLGNPSVLLKQPKEFSEQFYYMEAELGAGAYRAAVCSTEKDMDTEIKVIQLGRKYGEK